MNESRSETTYWHQVLAMTSLRLHVARRGLLSLRSLRARLLQLLILARNGRSWLVSQQQHLTN